MPRLAPTELKRLPLRVHSLLADVPLHDSWFVDLPRPRGGISLDDFLNAVDGRLFEPARPVRALLSVRFALGRFLGWDRAPRGSSAGLFADRLAAEDRAASRRPPGTRDGLFRIVYRFENEQLVELLNATAHAAALTALIEMQTTYRLYFAVYVRRVGPWTPIYLALIDPVRKLVVYPSLLRGVQAQWKRTMSAVERG